MSETGGTGTAGRKGAGTRTAPGAGSPRERYRTQVRAEIKERAWEQIADAGASALSLNAIAKRMGMSGPALYRYFGSRDELITELIRDAYRDLADTFRADADNGRGDAEDGTGTASGADLASLAHAMRRWARADPHRYFLVFGTPVPGYHAPDDVTGIASEIMAALLDACAKLPARTSAEVDDQPFDRHIKAHGQWAGEHPATPAQLHRALSFWTRLHGVLSLELAGHFTGMGFDAEAFFEAELEGLLAPA
ncbi:TetR family transcriptional regulator [Streptomyces sp. WAC 01529]|uniref:TetR/AcrR family transcriptional regulator n=1 Tax=Streptomyces sp. WAC 01529 TaxID=2203205 RepID=UPI000F6EC79B|nr:TetR/AcrR family transcriptional regulator [Streptomyces sp. WAC 01529]AZM57295.1 TetR family transcriptional regulator [Streptomyces sp. WAC 01529]